VSRVRLTLAAACVAAVAVAPAAVAKDHGSEKLRRGVTLAGLLEHERNFQSIATMNGGTRTTGTAGYEASVDYVVARLERAGYNVRREPFNYPDWVENSPPQLTAAGQTWTPGTEEDSNSPDVDFITFRFSAAGDTGVLPVVPVTNIVEPPTPEPSSAAGCSAADYPAETEGAISLIQRGTCPFVQKLALAAEAGAAGVILYNEGNPGRTNATFQEAPPDYPIPAVMASYEVAHALLTAAEPTARIVVDATTIPRFFDNVVAESRTGDFRKKVMLGAHLDSVEAGPGINDNASGSSTLLEIAEQLARQRTKLTNQVAFAFWGAEENGLVGSTYFVEHLSAAQRSRIMANLNFDMLASPNFVRFVYDGDLSDSPDPGDAIFAPAARPGSAAIEAVFNEYFASEAVPAEPTPFNGRSDYGPFIAAGIPAGGLFSGAEGVKTAEQAATYGGAAGSWYDPCYHFFCDTFGTITGAPPEDQRLYDQARLEPGDAALMRGGGTRSLDSLADAAAHTTWYLATKENPLGTP
jgi:Zn-dependent M28 family amino/carboxypeptidase